MAYHNNTTPSPIINKNSPKRRRSVGLYCARAPQQQQQQKETLLSTAALLSLPHVKTNMCTNGESAVSTRNPTDFQTRLGRLWSGPRAQRDAICLLVGNVKVIV